MIVNDKSVNDKSVNDKSVNDKSVNDKSVNDKSVNDKSVNDKSVNDKSVNDKSVNDKSVNDKSVNDKSVKSKSVNDKLVKSNLVNDKLVKSKSVKINSVNDKLVKSKSIKDEEDEADEEEVCSLLSDITCEMLAEHFSKIPIFDYDKIKLIPIKKLNIFVFQISSYEELPVYANLSEKINRAYCLKHGYKFEHIKIDYKTNNISPYWLRVYQIRKILLNNPEINVVVYLDLDACFREFDIRIEQVLDYVDKKRKFSWYFGWENKSWLNAGFGIFLNNEISIGLVNVWLKYYENVDKKFWYKNHITHKWVATTYDNWGIAIPAKDAYEQFRLNQMYTEEKLRPHICPLYEEYLCNQNTNINSFVFHFYGFKRNIVEVFKSIISIYNIQ